MEQKTTKVAIALITNRQVKPQTVFSLMNLEGIGDAFPIVATEGYTVAENRLYAVVQAKKNECTHILFIDDDMVFPAVTLQKMLRLDKDVVGVVAYSRKPGDASTVEIREGEVLARPDVPSKPFKAHAVGGGVLLVKMDVFGGLQEPYFGFKTYPNGVTLMGEDSWFCERVRNAGKEIWVDPTIEIKHLGDYEY